MSLASPTLEGFDPHDHQMTGSLARALVSGRVFAFVE